MPLGITELCRRVGDDNIKLQRLFESISNVRTNKRGDTSITFQTNQITATDFVNDNPKMVGFVIWMPKELVGKVRDELQKIEKL